MGCGLGVGVFFFFSLKVVVLFFWDGIHVVFDCFLIWDRLLLSLYHFSFKEVFSFPERGQKVLKSENAWEIHTNKK